MNLVQRMLNDRIRTGPPKWTMALTLLLPLRSNVRKEIVLSGHTSPISGEEMERESLIRGTGFHTK